MGNTTELCQQVGETPQLFPVLRGLTMFYSVRADHKTTYDLAEKCLSLAQHEQDPIHLMGAYLELGAVLSYLGRFTEALKHLEKGVALYDPQKNDSHVHFYGYNLGIACLARLATPLWLLGYPDQALKRSQKALSIAQQQAHPFSLAYALCFAAECHQLRREEHVTQERTDSAIRLSAEQGFPLWEAGATIYRGWALSAQGQYQEGIEQVRKGMGTWLATGAELGQPQFIAVLAESYKRTRQIEEGLTSLAEAMALVNKTGERLFEAELYRLKGTLTLQSKVQGPESQNKDPRPLILDSQGEAEACFLKAIEVAQKQQAKSWELRAATSLARLWQQQGKQKEAHQLLSEIYHWFTEGFNTKDLQEAKALLEELT